MSDLVTFEKQGQVGVITVNNPPVNALSQGVRQGLLDGIAKGLAEAGVSAMVIIGGGAPSSRAPTSASSASRRCRLICTAC